MSSLECEEKEYGTEYHVYWITIPMEFFDLLYDRTTYHYKTWINSKTHDEGTHLKLQFDDVMDGNNIIKDNFTLQEARELLAGKLYEVSLMML